jgi:hypothetical protein
MIQETKLEKIKLATYFSLQLNKLSLMEIILHMRDLNKYGSWFKFSMCINSDITTMKPIIFVQLKYTKSPKITFGAMVVMTGK